MKLCSKIFLLSILVLVGCSDSGELWRDGNYVVPWIDSNTYLSYGKPDTAFYGLVKSKVLAIGSNENHIVAKRLDEESHEISYYVIDREKQESNGTNGNVFSKYFAVTGPLNVSQFKIVAIELQLPRFTVTF